MNSKQCQYVTINKNIATPCLENAIWKVKYNPQWDIYLKGYCTFHLINEIIPNEEDKIISIRRIKDE